jgi:pilus assembly protein CpaB
MRRKVVLLVVAVVIAAVGASLVLLYVNGLTTKAQAKEQLVSVLTATSQIDPGEQAAAAQSDGKFALTKVPKSSVVAGAVTSVDSMSSEVALSTIYPGEQILAAKFGTTAASAKTLPIPKGQIAVSVELTDPARVAGFVTPGSHVVIFVSAPDTTSGTTTIPAYTRVLVPDVTVIGVGQTTELSVAGDSSSSSTSSSASPTADTIPQTILTVALDQENSDRVLLAASTNGLAFGLLGEGTKIRADQGVTAGDLHQ